MRVLFTGSLHSLRAHYTPEAPTTLQNIIHKISTETLFASISRSQQYTLKVNRYFKACVKVNSLSLIITMQTPYSFSLAVFHTSDNFSHRGCLKRLLPFTLKSSKAVHCSGQCGTKSMRQKDSVKIFQTIPELEQPKVSFFLLLSAAALPLPSHE